MKTKKNKKKVCWKGFFMLGMKMKRGKLVPNCVPKSRTRRRVRA